MEMATLLSRLSDQLCEICVTVESLAAQMRPDTLLRTEPTMPPPIKDESSNFEPFSGSVIDPTGFLERHAIDNPGWSLDAQRAAYIMGVAPHTVRHLAEEYDLPHLMKESSGRGPGGRCRVYSWMVCVQYMNLCYSLAHVPNIEVKLLTCQEAATMLEVSSNTVAESVKADRLPAITYGRRRYFFQSDVATFKGATSASR